MIAGLPDLVGFVNGLPLVVIELKKPGVLARAAFDENLTHYRERIDTSPQPSPFEAERETLFWSNALLIASTGTDSRVGSLTAESCLRRASLDWRRRWRAGERRHLVHASDGNFRQPLDKCGSAGAGRQDFELQRCAGP